ncbi:hypothetical protein BU15DRAFT_90811 [Melanogaster broomeanus]|nr:hypothetical protein BU15DRAFT_90811 [Melanogaster broomeanus]
MKFIVNAIGNMESCQSSLADCMLELIRCAKQMSQLQLDPEDDVGFWMHAKNTFNRRFYAINTNYHSLALFLHPMCRKLAITQAANGRSMEFMIKVALEIAKHLKWDSPTATKLVDDMRAYNLSRAPFAGGQANAHPLKNLAIRMLSIVPHVGDVKRLFSDLGSTQSPQRCNLSVQTFETLGKICANLRHHVHSKDTAMGKETRRWHAHMHTRKEPGINMEVVEDLNENFTWLPPLSALSDDDLAGPETISVDDVDAEFAALEQQKVGELLDTGVDGMEVLEGNVYDFDELARVDEGIVPRGVDDEIVEVDYEGDDGGWDINALMSTRGLACP